MKKIIIGCAIALVLGLAFLALIFYSAFRPKYKDVSNERPYSELIGKKIKTKRKVLILEKPTGPIHEGYAYHLEDGTAFGLESDLPTIVEFPIGSEVVIDKVELHTGRVSGTTSAYLFGKIHHQENQTAYAFEYNWGNYHSLYEDKPYWSFGLAFWQDEAIEGKFYIDIP